MGTSTRPDGAREIRVPVVEIFGPTIQGEGPLAGTPCHFIRFGGCDYKCIWCDSPHAVLADRVRAVPKLSAQEIIERLEALEGHPRWVIFSGGNPCMHRLDELISLLRSKQWNIQVETQGTLWKPWLVRLQAVVVSPKPPSSQMEQNMERLQVFLSNCVPARTSLKVVVFNEEDLHYAKAIHAAFPRYEFFLSVGNVPEEAVDNEATRRSLGDPSGAAERAERFRWLAEVCAADPGLSGARVLPQLHVLAWGNERAR